MYPEVHRLLSPVKCPEASGGNLVVWNFPPRLLYWDRPVGLEISSGANPGQTPTVLPLSVVDLYHRSTKLMARNIFCSLAASSKALRTHFASEGIPR